MFEELAQAAATQSVQSLVGQAIAELHLGRLPESEAAFGQALKLDGSSPDVLANLIVLNTILGKDSTEQTKTLEKVSPEHQLLVDLEEKRAEFERAASKWSAKVQG